jgi:peptidylprolyl isomerase
VNTAQPGSNVKVHYTGRLDDGTVFDTSQDRDPLEFTVGTGQVIPGFEEAVMGMSVGESRTHRIEAEDAYGEHRDEMVLRVEREHLPPDLSPETGQQLQIQQSSGEVIPVIVTEVDSDTITLDANHPLAGQPLTFDIELIELS